MRWHPPLHSRLSVSVVQFPTPSRHAPSRCVSYSRIRIGVAIVAVTIGCVCPFKSVSAECIDYGDYLHWAGSVDTRGWANGVAVSGTHAYVADWRFRSPGDRHHESPEPADRGQRGHAGRCLWRCRLGHPRLRRGRAIRSPGDRHHEPAEPPDRGQRGHAGRCASGVAVSGTYAYVADGASGLQVIDITNPQSPQIVGSVDTPGYASDVAVSGTHAYVADACFRSPGDRHHESAEPADRGQRGHARRSRGVAVSGTHAYVADDAPVSR